jgi:cob(I)alamin adenosyltransferase
MAIYTKKGDKGKTSLYTLPRARKIRIAKSAPEIEALGAIDEVNSYLGVVAAISDTNLRGEIEKIQNNLFTISSLLAQADLEFPGARTKELEKKIDRLEKGLPPLANFILPGGCEVGAGLHFARTLVRKAERATVALKDVRPEILSYLNRLSDYIFLLARKANFAARPRVVECRWNGPVSGKRTKDTG